MLARQQAPQQSRVSGQTDRGEGGGAGQALCNGKLWRGNATRGPQPHGSKLGQRTGKHKPRGRRPTVAVLRVLPVV
jgi:hypothetical protein